ncbi:7218_t:CDS:2 [Paraglomus occultum]|uniref:7218_t:CDS:1 n=1 Tax=Paraglomus occultum TaxID=144539 RepID=A0A9N9BSS6_9GLOM|nr:7218_t:CDS:2 [Paraglomus occultum]
MTYGNSPNLQNSTDGKNSPINPPSDDKPNTVVENNTLGVGVPPPPATQAAQCGECQNQNLTLVSKIVQSSTFLLRKTTQTALIVVNFHMTYSKVAAFFYWSMERSCY